MRRWEEREEGRRRGREGEEGRRVVMVVCVGEGGGEEGREREGHVVELVEKQRSYDERHQDESKAVSTEETSSVELDIKLGRLIQKETDMGPLAPGSCSMFCVSGSSGHPAPASFVPRPALPRPSAWTLLQIAHPLVLGFLLCHRVLELPLEVVPFLHREALLVAVELPRSLFLVLEALRLLCAYSPLLSTSPQFVWPGVRELLAHVNPVFACGLDAEVQYFVDRRSRVAGSRLTVSVRHGVLVRGSPGLREEDCP